MAEEKKTATVKPIAKAAVKAEAAKEEKKEAVVNAEAPKKEAPAKKAAAPKKAAPAKKTEAPKKEAPAKKAEAPKKEAPAKKAEAPKKAAPAKKAEAPKKAAPAKKAAAPKKAEVKNSVNVEWGDKKYSDTDLIKIAKDVWVYDLKQKAADFKSVEIYVKPFENVAYYVINGTETGNFNI